MASVTQSITWHFYYGYLLWTFIGLGLIICACIVWRSYLIEKTKRMEIEFDFKKATLRKIKDNHITKDNIKELYDAIR